MFVFHLNSLKTKPLFLLSCGAGGGGGDVTGNLDQEKMRNVSSKLLQHVCLKMNEEKKSNGGLCKSAEQKK